MRPGLVWTLGALAGTIGALVLYDARTGINWTIWTTVAVAGLLIYRRPDRPTLRKLALPLGLALLLSVGAAVTTSGILVFAIFVSVPSLLALALILAPDRLVRSDYGAVDIITAPLLGFAMTVRGAVSAVGDTVESLGVARERPMLRGSLLAAPVVIALALLFAAADPVLARGRDAIYNVFGSWDQLPRVIFGVVLTLFVTGAYVASRRLASGRLATRTAGPAPTVVTSRIGLTERRVVLIAAAAVSWIFVLLQLSYLFGAAPSVAGSGITFADYAHRGFGELTVAATGVALLIVAAQQRVEARELSRVQAGLMWPALALIAAVGCILVSCFHRISLYEAAYGYTTERVYVQVYVVLTGAILCVLAWHVSRAFDGRALARQMMTIALLTLATVVFWNGDSWVARANIQRYGETGKLDVGYLARGLSDDALPVLVQSLLAMTGPKQAELASALAEWQPAPKPRSAGPSWYEWNLRRARARSISIVADTVAKTVHIVR